MINKNTDHFPVRMMCRLLSVSVSGYCDWRDRAPSKRAQENTALAAKIKTIFAEARSRAGAKRFTKRLQAEGSLVGKHRVARIMRLQIFNAG